jgi:hypothetical protein
MRPLDTKGALGVICKPYQAVSTGTAANDESVMRRSGPRLVTLCSIFTLRYDVGGLWAQEHDSPPGREMYGKLWLAMVVLMERRTDREMRYARCG